MQRERLAQEGLRRRRVAQEDQPRRRALAVELAEEGLEQLGRPGLLGVARIVRSIAVVATVAVEEHLHAGLPAVLRERHHVGIVDRADVDALARGDVGERLEAVADRRRLLELERLGRRRHPGLQLGPDLVAAAGEEGLGLLEQERVVGRRDAADARRRAALDLILQAGPGAVLEDAVGAGAQRERAQQAPSVSLTAPEEANGPK